MSDGRLGQAPGPPWMRALAWAVARLPFRWLRGLGAALGFVAGSLLRVRRRHVEAAIARAGIASSGPRAREMYASLGAGLFELLWLAGRPPGALAAWFTMDPACGEALRRTVARGRGVIVATAHTGNWDLTGCASAQWIARECGTARLHVVTKRLSWRALDRYWQRLRAERGVVLADALGAATYVRDALAAGDFTAMLIDQVPERSSGVAVIPFLGAPALHDLGPALLAARARVPVLLVLGHREPDGRHRIELAAEIDPAELRGKGAIERATAKMASALEAFVREHPAQWLWLHRRWKNVPESARQRTRPK
ncbi:MAG: lysophospholipid acyltransferase family protein [Byssovorax sp.]